MLGSVCVYFRSPIHRRRLVCMIDATVCRGVTRSEAVWVEESEGGIISFLSLARWRDQFLSCFLLQCISPHFGLILFQW